MSTPITDSGVVVGVDGSPAARCAVDWAAREAAMRGVRLTLVHAVQPIGLTLPPLTATTAFSRWRVEQGQKILDDAVETARATTPAGGPEQIETEMLFSPVVPVLVDLSKDANLVCRRFAGARAHRQKPAGFGQFQPHPPRPLPGGGHSRRGPTDAVSR